MSVREFNKMASALAGGQVTVRGYLVPLYPDLALYADKTLPSIKQSPIVIVMDLSVRSRGGGGEASVLMELGCTDNYAEVKGLVGETPRGVIGVTQIISIHTYLDADFNDGGTMCFTIEPLPS
jgi:hypothetical protein